MNKQIQQSKNKGLYNKLLNECKLKVIVKTKYNNGLLFKGYVKKLKFFRSVEKMNNEQEYKEIELKPIYDGRKSFYKKANTFKDGNKTILISYQTKVCFIENKKAVVYGTYSNTTLRHIKEFLKQNGFKAEDKKQILNDYGVKE